jgi:UDP:flavonoid glycosyltransferase YjiC (YdhE family)
MARRLQALGHAPVIATCSIHADLVRGEGLEFAPLRPDIDPTNRALIARVMDPKRGSEVVLRELVVPGVADAYADLMVAARGADLIVTHPIIFAGPMVAETLGLPWVSTVLSPLSFFSLHDFPVMAPMPQMVHLRKLGPWTSRALMRIARRMTRSWMAPVVAFRARLGLAPGGDPLYEGQFSPHGTLALFSRVIGPPQPDWPVNAHATGFVFDNRAIAMPPGVSEFLDRGEPPVVFTLGSSAIGSPGAFYEESVQAVRALGQRAILLIGNEDNRPRDPLPPGVLAVLGAPHDQVFPRAAAIVHQGGIGTTAQALRSGRPTLVVPHAHDQPDNAFRVSNLGVARVVYPPRYRAARVATELRRLLNDSSYAQAAAKVADVVKAEDGAGAAARFLVGT